MKKNLIKTFENACVKLGLDPKALPDVSMIPEPERGPIISHYKLTVIVRALNDEWVPNWKDQNEIKWQIWFDMSGSAPSFRVAGYWRSVSGVGSRLCFKSRELAEYAGKKFIKEFREYFVITS